MSLLGFLTEKWMLTPPWPLAPCPHPSPSQPMATTMFSLFSETVPEPWAEGVDTYVPLVMQQSMVTYSLPGLSHCPLDKETYLMTSESFTNP